MGLPNQNTRERKLVRPKKGTAQLVEGKGKVGDKGLRKEERRRLFQELEAMGKAGDKGEGKVGDKGKGNKAVTATVRPKKGEAKNRVSDPASVLSNVRLMPGTGSSLSDHRFINVRISKWEHIDVLISTCDSYADITSKIQLRARELRMSMPSNWELLARMQSVCMFKNLVDCREFVIVPPGPGEVTQISKVNHTFVYEEAKRREHM
jgi:hypothetical protein